MIEGGYGARPEHFADHGRVAEQRLPRGRKFVEAGGDERLQRFRECPGDPLLQGDVVGRPVSVRGLILEQAHELLGVERVARRAADDRLSGLAEFAETVADPADELLGLGLRQRFQVDAHHLLRGSDLDEMGSHVGTDMEELRSSGADGE